MRQFTYDSCSREDGLGNLYLLSYPVYLWRGIKALIKVVRTAKGAPCFAKITPPSPPNSYLLPLDI